MISWIKGNVVTLWQTNNKFFILVDCNNLGYEIQILESTFIKVKTKQLPDKKITLWLRHIKKEDSDSLFGFISKDQKDFFNEILIIKGIGSQIAMSMLNRFSVDEIINAIKIEDKKLISSVQGIGKKMTERLILELRSNLRIKLKDQEEANPNEYTSENSYINSVLKDIDLTLQSLNYPKKEIKKIFPILTENIKNSNNTIKEDKKISFEVLLKEAMNLLDG